MTEKTEISQLIEFFHFLEGLKKLERYRDNVFWRDYGIERWESVADHTWRVAMIVMTLEKRLEKPIDLAKAFKLTLIHDLPEIIAGDPSPLGSDGTGKDSHRFSEKMKAKKFSEEDQAAKEIFGKLPADDGEEYYQLWLEYEEQSSYEAKVVKAADKIEAKLYCVETTKCHIYEGHFEPMTNMNKEYVKDEPIMNEIFEELTVHIKENYQEFK